MPRLDTDRLSSGPFPDFDRPRPDQFQNSLSKLGGIGYSHRRYAFRYRTGGAAKGVEARVDPASQPGTIAQRRSMAASGRPLARTPDGIEEGRAQSPSDAVFVFRQKPPDIEGIFYHGTLHQAVNLTYNRTDLGAIWGNSLPESSTAAPNPTGRPIIRVKWLGKPNGVIELMKD